jgi:2-oxoglutarate ferredoxin oxidoreductase subunit gamma
VVVDPNLTKKIPTNVTQKIIKVDLVEIAKNELGKPLFAAVIAVGMLATLTGIISEENIIQAVLDNSPKGTEEINRKAVLMGIELGKKHK